MRSFYSVHAGLLLARWVCLKCGTREEALKAWEGLEEGLESGRHYKSQYRSEYSASGLGRDSIPRKCVTTCVREVSAWQEKARLGESVMASVAARR